MKITTIFAGLALTFLSGGAFGDPLDAQTPPRERAREVLPPEVYVQLETLANEIEAEGFPSDPLFLKAIEGVAKGRPPERIMPAVSDHAALLLDLRAVLGPETPLAVVVAGADALRRGVPAESLEGMETGERTPMALVVLADLVAEGVPADQAVDVVREAQTRQTAEEAMLSITAAVRGLIRDGRSATSAADAVRRAIRDGRPIRDLPTIGGDRARIGVPVPPGAEPVTVDRRRASGGA